MIRRIDQLKKYHEAFQRDGIVLLPQFLDESLMIGLEKSFQGEFKKQVILEEAQEYSPVEHSHANKTNFLFNSEIFLESIKTITGFRPDFGISRVYFTDSTCVPFDWHDDSYSFYPRMAALRIELSRKPYTGGNFHFNSGKEIFEIGNMKFGDAVLFKVVTQKYFHKVDAIISGERRSIIVFLNIKDFNPGKDY
jgi:hypothetical protein